MYPIPKHVVDRYSRRLTEQLEWEIVTGIKNSTPQQRELMSLTRLGQELLGELEFADLLATLRHP